MKFEKIKSDTLFGKCIYIAEARVVSSDEIYDDYCTTWMKINEAFGPGVNVAPDQNLITSIDVPWYIDAPWYYSNSGTWAKIWLTTEEQFLYYELAHDRFHKQDIA